MDVEEETAASPPFSFSAAWSASSASSVSAFFAPRSRPSVSAPVPSASSASFSSPNLADSSSSSSSSQIVCLLTKLGLLRFGNSISLKLRRRKLMKFEV